MLEQIPKLAVWDKQRHAEVSVESSTQADHSPDNVTVCGTPAHVKCYSYHAGTSVIVSSGGRNATVRDLKPKWNAQAQQVKNGNKYAANGFRPLFPDISLTFTKIPDISLTAVKIPDISRFSTQVVTMSKSLNWLLKGRTTIHTKSVQSTIR